MRRRLGRLESGNEALLAADAEESERRARREALSRMTDEELDELETAFEEAMKRGTGNFEDLYAVVQEGGRRALDAYTRAVEAARRGEEPEKDARAGGSREVRDGYRIWKYYRGEEVR